MLTDEELNEIRKTIRLCCLSRRGESCLGVGCHEKRLLGHIDALTDRLVKAERVCQIADKGTKVLWGGEAHTHHGEFTATCELCVALTEWRPKRPKRGGDGQHE